MQTAEVILHLCIELHFFIPIITVVTPALLAAPILQYAPHSVSQTSRVVLPAIVCIVSHIALLVEFTRSLTRESGI
jgi:hypothetical protein